jgi:hypothetical protein
MNDPRQELSPYWLSTISPFDWSKIPAPPALPPWFPPVPTPAGPPPGAVDHFDSANNWGATAEPPG